MGHHLHSCLLNWRRCLCSSTRSRKLSQVTSMSTHSFASGVWSSGLAQCAQSRRHLVAPGRHAAGKVVAHRLCEDGIYF